MKRARVAAAGAVVLVLLGIAASRSSTRPEASAGAETKRAEPPALAADAVVVRVQPVGETVRTVGTLLANESVTLVSELSRRLVAVEFTEGSQVRKGDRLFRLDDADLRAQLAELEVRRQLAARTLERQRALLEYEKKALSQQAYDQAATDLQGLEAEIASLRVTLAKTAIRAPFDGRVGLRRVSEGAWITPETPLATLQDTSRIKIDFSLPERHAGALSVGQPFTFRVAGRGESFS
ncbi:MAG TPA: efflux RND transporter periplasmic adaptor subunit, partial [Myxococcota bacterium]|nr:efflux RND transporter periplasmic adaptor subunit [Myxococcota bacterium]